MLSILLDNRQNAGRDNSVRSTEIVVDFCVYISLQQLRGGSTHGNRPCKVRVIVCSSFSSSSVRVRFLVDAAEARDMMFCEVFKILILRSVAMCQIGKCGSGSTEYWGINRDAFLTNLEALLTAHNFYERRIFSLMIEKMVIYEALGSESDKLAFT
jgi:hypothetical protein